MKSIIKVLNMNNQKDVVKIQEAIAQVNGIIACEISREKKEVQVIYNENYLDLDKIVESIENYGYMIL